jgi:osmotically-inducible protein OsmY
MAGCTVTRGARSANRGRAFQPSGNANADQVTRRKRLYVLAFVIILAGTLPGCAAYSAYTKCGSGGCPGDAKITAEVRALLNQHPALGPPNQIYVQTLDRVVYLTGQTATDLQRDTAESVAREAPGLSRVVNTIALTYTGR